MPNPHQLDEIMPIARGIAHRHARRYPTLSWERDDMIGDALLLGLQALHDWDPTRSTWQQRVSQRIRWGLIDLMRHHGGPLTRWEQQTGRQVADLPGWRLQPVPLPDDHDPPMSDRGYAQVDAALTVRALLRLLTPRERYVIVRHDLHGLRLLDVGAELGLTESRISQIRKDALAKMRAGMEDG